MIYLPPEFSGQINTNRICTVYKDLSSSKKQCHKQRVQRAKKVVSDSPGLVDFAIGLVNSVLNLPDGQVKYFEEFNLQKNCDINSAHQKILGASENDSWASKS